MYETANKYALLHQNFINATFVIAMVIAKTYVTLTFQVFVFDFFSVFKTFYARIMSVRAGFTFIELFQIIMKYFFVLIYFWSMSQSN